MLKDVKTSYMPIQTAKTLLAHNLGNEAVPEIWEHIASLIVHSKGQEAE